MTKFFAVTILLASLSQGLWAFTVTGTLSYEKRVYTANNGVGTVVATPLSNAKILASDNSSTTTDATGSFSLNLASGSTYSVSVRSENSRFSVGTSSTSSPYSVFIGSGITGDNVITRTIKESEKSGAFNILVQLQTGVDWFAARGKNFSGSALKVIWPDASGTYFDQVNKTLSILGSSNDPDQFDDPVILHEFGHYCIDTFSLDHSEGGNHSYTDSSLDLRLAWSEGVATWISCAIRDDDEYRDSNGSSVSHYKITDAPNNSSARTSANEWAVSYLIWKASKNVGTFDNTVTVLASFKNLTEQISLDTFYDQWQSVIGTASNLATYVDQVGMSYKLDNDEPSASTSPVDLGALSGTTTKSSLTFFGTGDEDIYKFTPSANTTYTISTQNSKNGALTQLDIYKGNLSTLIGSNAQANGSFGDSTSSIGVTATDATPIYIKVTRFNSSTHNYGYGNSSTPYGKTVGKYGSYDVNVSIGGSSGSVSPPTTSSSVASSGGGGGGCLLR